MLYVYQLSKLLSLIFVFCLPLCLFASDTCVPFHTVSYRTVPHYTCRGDYIGATTNRRVTIEGSPLCAQTAHTLVLRRLRQALAQESS
jgi:hypothetical protein